ncbi:winged helix-turn-helix domain-containing protein [Serratia marcescens]
MPMKYIINLTVVFDPESRVLMLRNNHDLNVVLSNPATRLLSELIKNNKTELPRETLIKNVWEDYGFSPSSATLSNHISELRKSFESLGMSKDILVTVPRIGFKMDAEIHPETKQPQDQSEVEETNLPLPTNQASEQHNIAPKQIAVSDRKPSRSIKIPAFSLTITLLIIAVTAVFTFNRGEKLALMGIQDNCNIYAVDEEIHDTEQSERARKMLADEGIDCQQADRDIYYIETRQDNELLKVAFMAVCTRNGNMNYKNCNNYKQVE